MDNIVFQKNWQEESLIELKISVNSEFVNAYQYCYIQDTALLEISMCIKNYINNCSEACYLEFGKKEGNYTPAFSMMILSVDKHGHIKIEVDVEIDDNDTRCHHCCFFVNTELGLVEKLGIALKGLVTEPEGTEISLNL